MQPQKSTKTRKFKNQVREPFNSSRMTLQHSFSTASLNKIFSHFKPQQLTSSPIVDEQLSKIITLLLRDYISSWFSTLSNDEELYTEITKLVAHILSELEHRLSKVDWVVLITQDMPHVLINHIREHRACSEKFGTAYAGGKSLEELFHGCQPHIALSSPDAERDYVRRIADMLLDTLLPPQEYQSDTIRLLLREILTSNVFLMLIDYFSDPDYLNEMILRVLDPELLESPLEQNKMQQSEKSPVEMPASPIQVKLSPPPLDTRPPQALFEVKTSSFLKRKNRPLQSNSSFSQGFTKLSAGFGKMTGFDKFKNITKARQIRAFKRKETAIKNDLEFYQDKESNNLSSSLPSLAQESHLPHSERLLDLAKHIDDSPSADELDSPNMPDNPPEPEPEVKPVQKIETDGLQVEHSFKYMSWAFHWIRKLYNETKVGPWQLGPIDATKYDRYHLDEPIIELMDEVLDIQRQKRWLVTQILFFTDPIVHGLGSSIINRLVKLT